MTTEAMPHGPLTEVFSDVFFVTGTTRPNFMGSSWQFSRNMTILRSGGELTLINTVRLDDAGLASLDKLGKVTGIVKLGAFHGMDDGFYRGRYGAKQWALAGMTHEAGHATDVELGAGRMPCDRASLFTFESAAIPEGVLHLDRDGGVLVSCDSLQNWAEPDEYFDEASTKRMTEFGFIRPANIGPGWKMAAKPAASDFARLRRLSFAHLLPAHGKPLRDEAKAQLGATFDREFPQ